MIIQQLPLALIFPPRFSHLFQYRSIHNISEVLVEKSSEMTLEKFLLKIGVNNEKPKIELKTLEEIQLKTIQSISYENLSVIFGEEMQIKEWALIHIIFN